MKIRTRLKPEQATLLGLNVKKCDDGRDTARYYLNSKQREALGMSSTPKKKKPIDPVKIKEVVNDPKPFVLSAWNFTTGRMLDIDEYCEFYGLPRDDVKSYKLVSHTGTPFFNILFKEQSSESNFNLEEVKNLLKKQTDKSYTYKSRRYSFDRENVLKWSDLHFGAYIKNLLNVNDFDTDILLDGLLESINVINGFGFRKNHIHINGDLIESFSGLNHINSWQSMDSEMIGATAVKMCAKMLDKALQKVDNLGCIKIVAGNHDRLSKANDEDVKGGAAELIAYCLELMGYDVEFHPYVITHFVDGINHINLHGDKGISKKSTEKIILDYGIQGEYNLINEGHLHSVIEKLSIKQRENFEIVKDDSINHRRFYLPSFFTGNYYSATLGYTTNSGYYSIWNNGKNKPQFFNGSI